MAEPEWFSTQQAAQRLGMTGEWVRQQIAEERLVARYFTFGGRRTYRIHVLDLRDFERRYMRESGVGRR